MLLDGATTRPQQSKHGQTCSQVNDGHADARDPFKIPAPVLQASGMAGKYLTMPLDSIQEDEICMSIGGIQHRHAQICPCIPDQSSNSVPDCDRAKQHAHQRGKIDEALQDGSLWDHPGQHCRHGDANGSRGQDEPNGDHEDAIERLDIRGQPVDSVAVPEVSILARHVSERPSPDPRKQAHHDVMPDQLLAMAREDAWKG